MVPLGGSITKFGQEFWSDGFRTTLNFAFFHTIMNGVTAKFEAATGLAKVRPYFVGARIFTLCFEAKKRIFLHHELHYFTRHFWRNKSFLTETVFVLRKKILA